MTLRSDQDVLAYLDQLEKEAKALKNEALQICWYMRGGVTYQEALHMSAGERNIVADIVKDNLETTKKTGQPFF